MTPRCRAALAAALVLVASPAGAQSISLTGGAAPIETFDSLASSGTVSTGVPAGWYFAESGANANATYTADNGAANSGNTYSYGAASATERAFGGLQSSNLVPTLGAQLTNNTGATLTELSLEYFGEQWRLGATGRTDRLDFQYSTNATSLTTGTWTDFDALDFTAPVTGPTVGALDGNLAANRTLVSGSITGLSVANGGTIWVRWLDFNPSGADDGLAIDDVQFAAPGDSAPFVVSTDPADGATNVSPSTSIVVTFSEPVFVGANWYSLDCATGGNQTATFSGNNPGTTFTIVPDAALPNLDTCTLNLEPTEVTDVDGVIIYDLVGDTRFEFTIASDVPPTVDTTTPADNATNVALDATLSIKFSEAVTVMGSWYTIACATSGAHTAAVTGGPSNYILDPDVDFASGESCVVTITAALVTDQDGTPNAMAADYTFDFATVPDNAPDVQAFAPANDATNVNVASNVVVTFTEPVNVTGAWYAIVCATSGPHSAVVSGGPTTFTLNPDADFSGMESCTVTVESTLVTDQDGASTPMAQDRSATFTTGASPAAYYASVDASSCQSLRTTLHALIDDHTAFPYSAGTTDVWDILEVADQDPTNSGRILDVYRNRVYTKLDCRSGQTSSCPSGASNRYNREHTWPNAYGFNDVLTLGTDGGGNPLPFAPYTDTHMLYLSAEDYNSTRGSKPYADCPASTPCTEQPTDVNDGQGGGTGTYPGNSNWVRDVGSENQDSYEVWNFRKGDMARAILYMDVRYEGGSHGATGQQEPNLVVTDDRMQIQTTPSGAFAATGYMGLKSTLLAWHAADPPTLDEQLRNDVVYSYQGNRNPFIDHPEWVAIAFQSPCGGPPDALFKDGFENP
jgi:endonuclease I